MINYLRHLVGFRSLTATSTLLLAACSTKDPIVVGKEMAAGLCQAYEHQSDRAYAVQVQLAAEMKAGSLKTHVQYADRRRVLMRPIKLEDSLRVAGLSKLMAQLDADFPTPEARQTAGRVVTEGMAACDKAMAARDKTRTDPHTMALKAHLQGPDPDALPGYGPPGSAMPPPNPPPPATAPQ